MRRGLRTKVNRDTCLSIMRKYLETQIEERRVRLLKIDKERDTALAEKRTYEDALQHLISDGLNDDVKDTDSGTPPQGGFERSPKWLNIMNKLRDRGRSFDAGDMVNIGEEFGYATKIPNARSQISFYLKKGYIRRVRRGRYSIADKGQEVFKKEASTSSPADASNNSSGAATSLVDTN